MSAPNLESAEIRVTERLREHRKARRAYLAARDLLLEAIAERDTLRQADVVDGYPMTCEHGHIACGIASTDCTEHQS